VQSIRNFAAFERSKTNCNSASYHLTVRQKNSIFFEVPNFVLLLLLSFELPRKQIVRSMSETSSMYNHSMRVGLTQCYVNNDVARLPPPAEVFSHAALNARFLRGKETIVADLSNLAFEQ
jgi:hypothetical protein